MSEERHLHYDHYDPDQAARLDGFYGRVELAMVNRAIPWIKGKRVLDIGCGFGSVVEHLRVNGFEATGIDQLGDFIEAGRQRYPGIDLRHAGEDESLPFEAGEFDTVFLKDVIHHIFDEDDLVAFLKDVKRICRSRVIIVDPNPTLFLRLARKILRHVDPICPPAEAEAALTTVGMTVVHREFHEVIALPLSGGYISYPFIKGRRLGDLVLALDNAMLGAARLVSADKMLCWRYLIVADV